LRTASPDIFSAESHIAHSGQGGQSIR
jgi:hypothetical protein